MQYTKDEIDAMIVIVAKLETTDMAAVIAKIESAGFVIVNHLVHIKVLLVHGATKETLQGLLGDDFNYASNMPIFHTC